MKPNQHTAEQIITILDQALTGEQTVAAICRDYGMAKISFTAHHVDKERNHQ